MSERSLLAGIDGGQTSTKAVIATADGTVLATGTGPACDHLNIPGGLERNRQAIHGALRSAAREAGVVPATLVAVGLGLTSAQRELDPRPRIRTIVQEIAYPMTIWVDTDFVSNLAGASGGQPGIVVIAGGGSIGYGIDASGHEAIAGGLGYLMGDEGSGWFLGIEALQAAAKAADRRGSETALLSACLDHFGLKEIRHILRIIYRADFERGEVSALAPKVIDAARGGDHVAAVIVARGVDGLSRIALGVAEQLFDRDEPVRVYPTGGIFGARDLVLEPFSRSVSGSRPYATVLPPRFPPAIGALIRAAIDHGIAVDTAFLDRLEATLPGR
ncbi:MAG TPA: BadF/BadG/BcrA/BcrD ATPase family protein [Thermomicrobiales bacterium]|nr:BadF/BadG/BcrA/BcrD ATPase family protein [Thermomicrobiales bacterium]